MLGEALLFHGVLLPRMIGVFGRWAWLANAVVFGLYHVHMFWSLPSNIISSVAYSWTLQRYRSVWFAVLIHGFEGVLLFVIVSWVVWSTLQLAVELRFKITSRIDNQALHR